MRAFWNTYRPLCMNVHGQRASVQFSIPPYVDASCRREPDLEHAWPAISALCRGRAFAPRLGVGDVVVYATTRSSDRNGGWCVTGVLQVVASFHDHAAGALWYLRRGMPLPSNCLVEGSDPRPIAMTAEPNRDPIEWDDSYRHAVNQYPQFLVCRPLYINLVSPPRVSSEDAIEAFGKLPQSRTPLDWGWGRVSRLLDLIGIVVEPSTAALPPEIEVWSPMDSPKVLLPTTRWLDGAGSPCAPAVRPTNARRGGC